MLDDDFSRSTRRRHVTLRAVAPALIVILVAALSADSPARRQPQRVLLGLAGDAATSSAVTWRTAAPTATPQAQISLDVPGPDLLKTARTIQGSTREATGSAGTEHGVTLDGLRPGTRYAYRVGDGADWSPWYTFVTATASPAPFRFIYLGDSQNGLADVRPRVVRAAQAQASGDHGEGRREHAGLPGHLGEW